MSDTDFPRSRARQLIGQEAAEWFARMNDPNVSVGDRRRFLRWLKQSSIHIAEYLTVAEVDAGLRDAKLTALAADGEKSNVIELRQQNARPAQRPAAAKGVMLWPWKVAAAVLLFAVLGSTVFVASNVWVEPSIETQLGEWKSATLADGSSVQLGPNTLLTVDFSDAQRSLHLIRGEAYFSVAKDPARPFIVEADEFAVRAVGTQFAVSRRNDELIVTVTEGVVRVARNGELARGLRAAGELQLSVPIVADHQVRVVDTWPVTQKWVEVQYELAWKDKRLRFQEGDTLADAIEEFNVRNRLQLRLAPGAPRALPVRGNFDAADPQSFAETMDRTPQIRVVAVTPGVLRMMSE